MKRVGFGNRMNNFDLSRRKVGYLRMGVNIVGWS